LDYGGTHKKILEVPIEELLDEKRRSSITRSLRRSLVEAWFGDTPTSSRGRTSSKSISLFRRLMSLSNSERSLRPEQVKDLHFTCCGVADLQELEGLREFFESMKLEYVVFREPDIGNEKTAIGVYPVEEHKRGLLRNYNLASF
jgi:hypothetical protein